MRRSVRRLIAGTEIRTAYFEVAQDEEGRWHWCLWSGNGRIMARDPEGYAQKKHSVEAIKTLVKIMPSVTMVVEAGDEGGREAKEVKE